MIELWPKEKKPLSWIQKMRKDMQKMYDYMSQAYFLSGTISNKAEGF